jgi:O-antigen/teichoic acid export membrane protein
MTAGMVGQLLWLAAGSRVMTAAEFGAVLAAQAAYGVVQMLVDTGSGFYGARAAAARSLDDAGRGSILRLRLLVAVAGGALLLAVGGAGGVDSLMAAAPFVAALVLFALLRHWEPFGLGDSRPWSAYLVLRSALPAALAATYLVADAPFPLFLAGVAECAAIVAVAAGFRLRPLRGLRQAAAARSAPWRSVLLIGLPAVLGQVALASGTVLLNVLGAGASAAAFAVSVRLLTGVNHLSGVVPTALFPGLAEGPGPRGEAGASDARRIGIAVRTTIVVVAAANATLLAAPSFFVSLLLDRADADAETTAILVLGSAAATSLLVLGSMVLVARGFESTFVRIYAASTAVVLAGGAAVVALGPSSEAPAMASVFAVGQLVALTLLARAARASLPELTRPLRRGAGLATLVVAASFVPAYVTAVRPVFAATFALVSVLALASALVALRSRGAGGEGVAAAADAPERLPDGPTRAPRARPN